MTKKVHALVAALLLSITAAGCSEEEPAGSGGDLRAQLAELRDQIAEATKTAQGHKGDLMGEMAAMRRETLLLSAAMLENHLIAEEGGVPAKLVAPAASPDPVRAEQILRHIAAAEQQLEEAKEHAGSNDSVVGNLAQTTVVTQELALAQLRLAYYQSAYGLALPGREASRDAAAGKAPAGSAPADPARIAEQLRALEDGATNAGINPPAAEPTAEEEAPDARARTDPALSSSAAPPAAAPAPEEDRQDVTALIDSVKSDVPEKRAETTPPPREPASTPQRSENAYGREDTVRIQLLLQEAGFNPGTVDGRWGPRTADAIAEFQRTSGLPASGQPDAATLNALGFD